MLNGPEVKSIKGGNVNLTGAYISMQHDAPYIKGMHVGPYLPAKDAQKHYDPKADRKLLISSKQRISLESKLKTKGLTIIPLSVYSKAGLVKVEMALVRGKSRHDKREQLKKKAVDLDIRRELRGKTR